MPRFTAACVQMKPRFGAVAENIAAITSAAWKASADLVVFPELATSGYEFLNRDEVWDLAFDPRVSPEADALRRCAVDAGCYLAVGFPERTEDQVFNSALLISPQGELTVYRKLHLFDREKTLFQPGDREPVVVETSLGRIGLMICFDWIFPEVARCLALKGAQVICHPSNLVLAYCQRAMFARSVENAVFTLTCNRIGAESRAGRSLTFTGGSQILGVKGETLAQAGPDEEETIRAEIDPSLADNKQMTALNNLWQDRRVEFYRRLGEA